MRHVYLPALRDAERELASAGGDRVRMILRGLLGDDEHVDAFLERIGTELKNVAADPDVVRVSEKINEPLRDLTVGAHPQASELALAEPTFASIARSLRVLLGDVSAQPFPLPASGLGYANTLFIATVMAELDAAAEADLTVLTVRLDLRTHSVHRTGIRDGCVTARIARRSPDGETSRSARRGQSQR